MAREATSRSWVLQVTALFAVMFSVGTSELIVLALLPALAADLGVDIPTAGLLISGYAIGVAIAGPVLTLTTGSMPRRLLLLAMLAAFIAGSVLCALSTSYAMILMARLVVACCHGVAFGVALVITMRIAPAGRQTTAVSLVITGFTLATVFGVPIGTAIGNAVGWRATFWAIALMGSLAAVAVLALIPAEAPQEAKRSNLRAEVRAAFRPIVLISFAAIIFYMTGVFVLYSYLIPLVTEVSGVPLEYVPLVLFGMGFLGFFGNLASGRLSDWRPYTTMFGVLIAVIVLLVILGLVVTSTWSTVVVLCLIWFVGFGFPAPARTRVLKAVADAPNFTATLTSTAFNVGIASGAAVGSAVLVAGWGYAALPQVNVIFTALALAATLVLWAYERRVQPAAARPA